MNVPVKYSNCAFCEHRLYKNKVLHCSLTQEQKDEKDVCDSFEVDKIKVNNSSTPLSKEEEKTEPVVEKIVDNSYGNLLIAVSIIVAVALHETMPYVLSVFIIVACLVFSILCVSVLLKKYSITKTIKKFEKKIILYFNEEGYTCEKHEGVLYAKVKGNTFSIHLWDMKNPRMKRVYFVYDFIPEKIEDVSLVGLQFLAGYTNANFPHTTTIVFKDYIACRFETAISTIDDFDAEFKAGYSQIVDAVNYFHQYYEQIKADFPAETKKVNKVGFDLNQKE